MQNRLHSIIVFHILARKIKDIHYRITLIHKYNSVSVLIGKEGTWNIMNYLCFFYGIALLL